MRTKLLAGLFFLMLSTFTLSLYGGEISKDVEVRAFVLAQVHSIQTAPELRSFLLDLQQKFIRGYPFPDQIHLRRMSDWDAVVANVENEKLLQFYEKILADKKEREKFLAKIKGN